MFLHAQNHISAELGHIRKTKVSLEWEEHARSVHKVTQAHKIACMHIIFLCAQTHISAKLGQFRKIKVSLE